MIGYHFTPTDNLLVIQQNGLLPTIISEWEYLKFSEDIPNLPKKAIWVWKYRYYNKELLNLLIFLTHRHNDFKISLLRVKYSVVDTASYLVKTDIVKLYCPFVLGETEIFKDRGPIDLVTTTINDIKIIDSWNLLDIVRGNKQCL